MEDKNGLKLDPGLAGGFDSNQGSIEIFEQTCQQLPYD